MTNNQQPTTDKGFTMVESLVAIGVLTLAITGALTAVQSGLSSYIFSKNQVIAFYLAQEGFEQIRNMRDANGLSGNNWLTGIAANSSDPCWFGNDCTVDTVTGLLQSFASCPVVRQNVSTGFYGCNVGWASTAFSRRITLTQINANEISITVTIDWSKGLVTRQFKAKENLFRWQ